MTYEIDFSSKSKKIIKKLQKDFSLRVLEKFGQLREDPFRYLKHHEGNKCYKFRIGRYRALIDVDTKRKILFVRVFDKRGRIYKK